MGFSSTRFGAAAVFGTPPMVVRAGRMVHRHSTRPQPDLAPHGVGPGPGGHRAAHPVDVGPPSLAAQGDSVARGCGTDRQRLAGLPHVCPHLEVLPPPHGAGLPRDCMARPQNGKPPPRSGIRRGRHDGRLGCQQQHDDRGCGNGAAGFGQTHHQAPRGLHLWRPTRSCGLCRRSLRAVPPHHRCGRPRLVLGIGQPRHGSHAGDGCGTCRRSLLERVRQRQRSLPRGGGPDRRRKPRRRRGGRISQRQPRRRLSALHRSGHLGRRPHSRLRFTRTAFRIPYRCVGPARGLASG